MHSWKFTYVATSFCECQRNAMTPTTDSTLPPTAFELSEGAHPSALSPLGPNSVSDFRNFYSIQLTVLASSKVYWAF